METKEKIIEELLEYKDYFIVEEKNNGLKNHFEKFINNGVYLHKTEEWGDVITELEEEAEEQGVEFTLEDIDNIPSIIIFYKTNCDKDCVATEVDYLLEEFTREQEDFLLNYELDYEKYLLKYVMTVSGYGQDDYMEITFYYSQSKAKEIKEILDRLSEVYKQ